MKLITLHDHINPDQEVTVDADQIAVIEPFGSGAVLTVGGASVAVHETPTEVMKIIGDNNL
jgi:hypothetical protein